MSDLREMTDGQLSDAVTDMVNTIRRLYRGTQQPFGTTYSEEQLLNEYKRRHTREKVRERVRSKQ